MTLKLVQKLLIRLCNRLPDNLRSNLPIIRPTFGTGSQIALCTMN